MHELLAKLAVVRPEKYKASFNQPYNTWQVPRLGTSLPIEPATPIQKTMSAKSGSNDASPLKAAILTLVVGILVIFLLLFAWRIAELGDLPSVTQLLTPYVTTSGSITTGENSESTADSSTSTAEPLTQVDISALRPSDLRIFVAGLFVSLLIGWLARALIFNYGRIRAFFTELQSSLNRNPSDYRRYQGCSSGAATLAFLAVLFIIVIVAITLIALF